VKRATNGGLFLAGALIALATASPAVATDIKLLAAIDSEFERAKAASAATLAGLAGPEAVQHQYDTARDLEEALIAAEPVSRACKPLLRAARNYARATVMRLTYQQDITINAARTFADKVLHATGLAS
jgi:hypothetical protein